MKFMSYIKKLRDRYVINQVKRIQLPYFEPSPTVRKRLLFKGRVQKVGFRLEIYELAKRLNLTGWVKNRKDKNVEAEIQGEDEKIIFLVGFMKSLKRASVKEVIIQDIAMQDDGSEFVIIRE